MQSADYSCNVTSLRDRKKRETAQSLAAAAYTLASARGVDDVTTADIAETAGVSRRTFANYYANKHAAIVDGLVQVLALDLWRPDTEAELDSHVDSFNALIDRTHEFVRDLFTDQRRITHIQTFAAMVKDYPALEPYVTSVFLEFHHSSAHKHLAARFGEAKVSMFLGGTIGALNGIIHLILGPLAIPRNAPPLRVDSEQPVPISQRKAPILTDADITQILAYIDQTFTFIRHGFEED